MITTLTLKPEQTIKPYIQKTVPEILKQKWEIPSEIEFDFKNAAYEFKTCGESYSGGGVKALSNVNTEVSTKAE